MLSLLVDSSTLVTWTGMRNAATGAYLNSATVSFLVTTEDESETIAGPIAMSPTGASGNYHGVLPHATELTAQTRYKLVVTAVSGDYQEVRKIDCIAGYAGERA